MCGELLFFTTVETEMHLFYKCKYFILVTLFSPSVPVAVYLSIPIKQVNKKKFVCYLYTDLCSLSQDHVTIAMSINQSVFGLYM